MSLTQAEDEDEEDEEVEAGEDCESILGRYEEEVPTTQRQDKTKTKKIKSSISESRKLGLNETTFSQSTSNISLSVSSNRKPVRVTDTSVKCSVCARIFNTSKGSSGFSRHSCTNRIAKKNVTLIMNMTSVLSEEWPCDVDGCGFIARNKPGRDLHKKRKHGAVSETTLSDSDINYNCTMCSKKYKTKNGRDNHLVKVHQIEVGATTDGAQGTSDGGQEGTATEVDGGQGEGEAGGRDGEHLASTTDVTPAGQEEGSGGPQALSLIHISEPTSLLSI